MVRTLKGLIAWFVRLFMKDESEYEVDQKTKQKIYRSVRKEKNQGKRR